MDQLQIQVATRLIVARILTHIVKSALSSVAPYASRHEDSGPLLRKRGYAKVVGRGQIGLQSSPTRAAPIMGLQIKSSR